MTTFIAFVVLLGILIFVHEFGHFIFAKVLGVKVERFSLGFGPKLIGIQLGETEYRISAFPLGGYVKMLGQSDLPTEDDEELAGLSEEEKARAFDRQKIWKRFLIVLAGPLFNIIFAAVVFVPLFLYGVPVPYPDIGDVVADSPAQQAGFLDGDRVLAINNSPIEDFNQVEMIVGGSAGMPLDFTIKRGSKTLNLSVTPESKKGKDVLGNDIEYGYIGVGEFLPAVIGSVNWRSPAGKAGLKHGDKIIAIDKTPIRKWQDMKDIISDSPEKKLEFTVQRDENVFKTSVTPLSVKVDGTNKTQGRIGVRVDGNNFYKKLPTGEAVATGLMKTVDVSALTVVAVVKLIERAIPADTLGGPIMIAQMAGQQVAMGLWNYFWLLGVLSVNLGIINLFPIPILDGGLLAFLGIEAIKRKPLSTSTMLLAQKIGLFIILLLMALVFYNDILRLITGRWMP